MTNSFVFETDVANKKVYIAREFNAPVEKIWRAWTDPEILDKWWSPRPMKSQTKVLDLRVGGTWQFAMISPEGEKHWIYAEFTAIEEGRSYASTAWMGDADGNPITSGPKWHRDTHFTAIEGNRTRVNIEVSYEDEATFERMASGFFKQGTEIGYNQLDELLASE